MNQEQLEQTIRCAVDRAFSRGSGPPDEDAVAEEVLNDPDVQILLRGLDDHDRAEGLRDVYLRDIRRMIGRQIAERERDR